MQVAAQPELYDVTSDPPALIATLCAQCRSVQFPPNDIGCEVCGSHADLLQKSSIAARGVVHSAATVHPRPQSADTAQVVVEVLLDDGPLIRALLVEDDSPPAIGDRVAARWVVVRRDDDNDIFEPRFHTTSAPGGPHSGHRGTGGSA